MLAICTSLGSFGNCLVMEEPAHEGAQRRMDRWVKSGVLEGPREGGAGSPRQNLRVKEVSIDRRKVT